MSETKSKETPDLKDAHKIGFSTSMESVKFQCPRITPSEYYGLTIEEGVKNYMDKVAEALELYVNGRVK